MPVKFILILTFVSIYLRCPVNAQTSVYCKDYVYIEPISKAILVRLPSADTVRDEQTGTHYLRMVVKSCKGAMYLERRLISNNQLVFCGSFNDAIRTDTFRVHRVDPVTGRESDGVDFHHRARQTGEWRFYDEKTGKLIRKEMYEDGKNITIEKKEVKDWYDKRY